MPNVFIKCLVHSRTRSIGNTRMSPCNYVVPKNIGHYELGPTLDPVRVILSNT